jgi:hypothetical protein
MILRRLSLVLFTATLLAIDAQIARSQICLPPLVGEQPRLHQLGEVRVFPLELLLRQHEVCWRAPATPDEKRIFAFGNSSIFGFPHSSENSAVGLVNTEFDRLGVPAHLYNLGFVFTYQVKDAVILNESLQYEPDVIVYGVTLDDLRSAAPMPYPALNKFFEGNVRAVDRLAEASPPTLEEPIRLYQKALHDDSRAEALWLDLRRFGTFLRVRAADTAEAIRKLWFPDLPEPQPTIDRRSANYDCRETMAHFNMWFARWGEWNLLEYLAELKRERGIEVLVVNWPVNRQPRGECYNARYPTTALEQYTGWLERKTRSLGLPYLDLHDALEREDFVDSVHPTRAGQQKVAARLIEPLNRLLESSAAP